MAPARLKTIGSVLDATPALGAELLRSLRWAAEYYHHPFGAVLEPRVAGVAARRPRDRRAARTRVATDGARALLRTSRGCRARTGNRRARSRRCASARLTASELKAHDVAAGTLERLVAKGWIEPAAPPERPRVAVATRAAAGREPELTADQRGVLAAIAATQARAQGIPRLSAARRHGQRQDRDLLAAHRSGARGRPPDTAARARDRLDAAARAPPARTVRRGARRAALGCHRAGAVRRVAARLPRRSAARRRHAIRRVRAVAVGRGSSSSTRSTTLRTSSSAAFATRRAISPSSARSA